ncbi:hypothetical protein ATANTOWER_030008 [Ataeniobius toweri]|uniref:Uncharacterized protein n=1 Tax=Ataeniobius toweri TaxID=208326 RepID=A0ABU7BVB1_9TELE|nr:hypothetical protein [Ataeniobius toweri]
MTLSQRELPGNTLQLVLQHPKVFPDHVEYMVPPESSGSDPGSLLFVLHWVDSTRLGVALSIPNCRDESGSSRGVPGSAMARQQQWRVRTWARRGRLWRCAAEVWSCSGSHSDL